MNQNQASEAFEHRGVELQPFPPTGYIILRAIAKDGTLVGQTMTHESVDNESDRQFRIDRLWRVVEIYEERVLGARMTPSSPRAALTLFTNPGS